MRNATYQILDFINSGKGLDDLPEPVQAITTFDFKRGKYKEVQYVPFHNLVDEFSHHLQKYRINVMDWDKRKQLPGVEIVERGVLSNDDKLVVLENFPMKISPHLHLNGHLLEGPSVEDFGEISKIVMYDEKFGIYGKVLISVSEIHFEKGDVLVFSDSKNVVGDLIERPDSRKYRRVLLNGSEVSPSGELSVSYDLLWFYLSFGRELLKTEVRVYPTGEIFSEFEFLKKYTKEMRKTIKTHFLNDLWISGGKYTFNGLTFSERKFWEIYGEYLENLGITEDEISRVKARQEFYI